MITRSVTRIHCQVSGTLSRAGQAASWGGLTVSAEWCVRSKEWSELGDIISQYSLVIAKTESENKRKH